MNGQETVPVKGFLHITETRAEARRSNEGKGRWTYYAVCRCGWESVEFVMETQFSHWAMQKAARDAGDAHLAEANAA